MRKSIFKQWRLHFLWTLLLFGVFAVMIRAETVCAAPQKEEVGNNTWYQSGSIDINVLKMVDGNRENYINKKLTLFRDKAPEWNDCITNSYIWKAKIEGEGMLALSSNEYSTFKEYSIDESYTPIWQPSYLGYNGFAIEGTFTLPEGYKFKKNSTKSSTLLSDYAFKMHLEKSKIDKSYAGDQTCSFLIALHACQAGLMTSEKSKFSGNIIELILEPNQTEVVYDSNGGVGEVIKQTITYGEKAETKANIFSKAGYILAGWKDENGNTYDLNQDISRAFPADKQITLYAHWQKNKIELVSPNEKNAENKLRKMGSIKIEKEMKGLGCVVLAWEAMDSANGYKIYRATSKTGKYNQIYNCPATDDSSIEYINGNLKNGKVYCYKIRPYQRQKGKIVYGKYSNVIVDKIGKPKVVVEENKRGLLEISWDDYYNADGFLIYKKINKGKWKLIKKRKDGEYVCYVDKQVKRKQKYKYKVRAFKGKIIGPYSNVLTVVGK